MKKKQGGFSLFFNEEPLASTKSGKPAIIPGDPDGSELIRRLNSKDPEERMPYKHEPLHNEEIDVFTRWIKQRDQWAYLPVKKVKIPDVGSKWEGNNIDRFILEKLEDQNLQPSQEADRPVRSM